MYMYFVYICIFSLGNRCKINEVLNPIVVHRRDATRRRVPESSVKNLQTRGTSKRAFMNSASGVGSIINDDRLTIAFHWTVHLTRKQNRVSPREFLDHRARACALRKESAC